MQVYDDRDRQGKALSRWEKQKEVWANLQKNLSKSVNRPKSNQTLPGSIHHFRQKREEMTLLDASVPTEFSIGPQAWQMNLRSGKSTDTSAFSTFKSYVPFGVPYPYPLFVTVGDGVTTNPDSNSLMKVIPGYEVPPRHRPISESQFFLERQQQHKKNIQREYSHFLSTHDHLLVHGTAAPVTDQQDTQEAIVGPHLPAVTYHRMPSVGDRLNRSQSPTLDSSHQAHHMDTDNMVPISPAKKTGPSLTLSSVNLMKTVAPGKQAQLSLTATNTGTTVIFYNLIVRDIDTVPGLPSRPQDQANFVLSDVSSGVLLPDDDKVFIFSFRPLGTGSYSETLELLTVPACKERILVHLQVFAISEEENIAITKVIEDLSMVKGNRDNIRCYLTESLGSQYNNPLTISDYKATTSVLKSIADSNNKAHTKLIQERKRKWDHENNVSAEALSPAISAFANLTLNPKEHASHPSAGDSPSVNIHQPSSLQCPKPTTYTSNVEGPDKLYMPYHEILYGKMDNLYKNLYRYQRACDRISHHLRNPTPKDKIIGNDTIDSIHFHHNGGETSFMHGRGAISASVPRGHIVTFNPKEENTPSTTLEMEQKSRQEAAKAKEMFDKFLSDNCPACDDINNPITNEDRSLTPADGTSTSVSKAVSPITADIECVTVGALAMVNRCKGTTCIPAWNGSIRCIIEDISKVRDATVRSRVLKALNLLLSLSKELGRMVNGEKDLKDILSSTDKEDHDKQQCDPPSLDALITSFATNIAHEKVSVDIAAFAATAREIATGRIRRKAIAEPIQVKTKGTGKKGGSSLPQPVTSLEGGCTVPDEWAPAVSFIQAKHVREAKKRADEATEQFIGEVRDYLFEVLSAVCDYDGTVVDAHRMDIIKKQLEVNQPDLDSLVDNTVVKKRR